VSGLCRRSKLEYGKSIDSSYLKVSQFQPLRCVICKQPKRWFTDKEVILDWPPKFFSHFCLGCFFIIRNKFESLQAERLQHFVNKPHYWGILTKKQAQEIGLREIGQGFALLWECQSPIVGEGLVQVVENSHYDASLCPIPYPDFGEWGCNTYIFRRHGLFYLTRRDYSDFEIATLPLRRLIDGGPFFSFKSALLYIQHRHIATGHTRDVVCNCRQITRFATVDYSKSWKVLPRVWKLQDLCRFFVRNYFHYDKLGLSRALPPVITDDVASVSPLWGRKIDKNDTGNSSRLLPSSRT
jgi:hypothetical protein